MVSRDGREVRKDNSDEILQLFSSRPISQDIRDFVEELRKVGVTKPDSKEEVIKIKNKCDMISISCQSFDNRKFKRSGTIK